MATQIEVNIGSGNSFLPDNTMSLPQPVLTYLQLGLVALNPGAISQEMLKISNFDMSLTITNLRSHPYSPRAIELMVNQNWLR